MFMVNEDEAAAIRRAFRPLCGLFLRRIASRWNEGGELAAVVELRRHFPLISDGEAARRCVRAIVGWGQRSADPKQDTD